MLRLARAFESASNLCPMLGKQRHSFSREPPFQTQLNRVRFVENKDSQPYFATSVA